MAASHGNMGNKKTLILRLERLQFQLRETNKNIMTFNFTILYILQDQKRAIIRHYNFEKSKHQKLKLNGYKTINAAYAMGNIVTMKTLNNIVILIDFFQSRNTESSSFSCPVLRSGQNITTSERNWNTFFLNRGWPFETLLVYTHQ